MNVDSTANYANIDPIRCKQVIHYLVSNAIKFTAETGQITIHVSSAENDMIRVEITDTGIGIKETDLNQLFLPFQQLDTGFSKKFQGSGLGLALSKSIINAQGGELGVKSVFGEGSTFYFTLPRNAKS